MTKRLKYHGAVVPLVTPFKADGGLDVPALHRLVDSQVAGGVEGIFVLGTTGEGAQVPRDARRAGVAEELLTLVFVDLHWGCLEVLAVRRINRVRPNSSEFSYI